MRCIIMLILLCSYPDPTDKSLTVTVDFANKTHTITGVIYQIPNQPVVFKVKFAFVST